MNVGNILKYLGLVTKGLSLIAGLASYTNFIPAKWLPVAAIVFGIASCLKDACIHIADVLDDGVVNDSVKKP